MVEFLKKVFAGEPCDEANGEDHEAAAVLVEGVGGVANISKVWNCFTRLRFDVKDLSLVNDEVICRVPNSGIIRQGQTVQIVFGMKVKLMRKVVDEYLASL